MECSIALWIDGDVVGADMFPGARSCVEELMPRIEKLLASHGLEQKDIDKFAADIGPGGLTGIKIGLVAIKTVAQVLDKPVIPVSALHALCHGAPKEQKLILPVVKCTKNDFYAAIYKRDGAGVACAERDNLFTAESLAVMLKKYEGKDVNVTGSAIAQVKEAVSGALGGGARFGMTAYPAASAVCEIAAPMKGKSYLEVQPNYLCLTNAERNFGIRA